MPIDQPVFRLSAREDGSLAVILPDSRDVTSAKMARDCSRDLAIQGIQQLQCVADVPRGGQIESELSNDISRIHSLVDHMSRQPQASLAIDDCPVDRSASAILRQEAWMQIHSPVRREVQ